ncbi:MAG: alpha/beta hydrolase [Luteolibacter sp.]
MGIWILCGAVVLFAGIVWWCAKEIAEPGRREIQEGRQAYLDGTNGAGFSVEKFVSEGGMPVLVCTPEQVEEFSQRAGLIREQLGERGVELADSGEILGTVVIIHGRTGMKEDYLPVAERFCAVGFRCVIPDLPGHGANSGKYARYGVVEGAEVLDALREAGEKFGFSDEPAVVFGQSMGGSVAVHSLTEEGSRFQAAAIVSSFDSLETVVKFQTKNLFGSFPGGAVTSSANHFYSWKTGMKFSEIRPIDRAAKISVPMLMVHGDEDTSVPFSSGKALFDAVPDGVEKEWLALPGADHNDILITDFPLYATIAEWFLRHLLSPE